MLAGARKYYFIFTVQLINSLAYPLDLFSRSFSMLIFMVIFLQLWRVTYSSIGQDQIAGMTLRDTLWYLMIAETVILSKVGMARGIAQNVRDGSIAYLLNRPYNFILYQFTVGLGDSLLRMVVNAVFGGTLVWLLLGPPPDWLGVPMGIVCIILAWTIDFCFKALIGLAAFLTEEVSAFEWIYSKLVLILGGVLIPLDFFPDWLREIALALPFAYTTYAPARIFIQPSFGTFARLVLLQGAWLLGLGAVLYFFYNWGVRRLVVNGG